MDDAAEQAFAERISAPLRRPERLSAGFEKRLMDAVRAEAAAERVPLAASVPTATDVNRSSSWGWLASLLRPRWHVSPIAGLALAAGFAGVVALGTLYLTSVRKNLVEVPLAATTTVETDQPARGSVVQFVLVQPNATSVELVGDFNSWQRGETPLQEAGPGIWTITLPLEPGRHQYAFVVDGEHWVLDPSAPRSIERDFGVHSSVVTVRERSS